ncbi:RHS repeat-associated core domain-containing protein [Pseudomonas donghuensis]|uniref:RHS repeat-associated core domain-containing protein n=1 Tax=Pseudomonas donghuensis TaxID=1163398 RepID=UPI0027147852|nr:RHS repeat-associated core domain-containing protein [Pseudomonas donghuensis]WKY28109.1 RHS repeat-associated core domain-containing protein [Pseudomonas donghuensis]
MSDALWAARQGDALMHTSMMADIVSGVLEVAANVAIGVLATAAVTAALGLTVATGGLGCFVLGAVVGIVVGVAMSKTGADKGLSSLCEGIGNFLFPPSVQANILTGSKNTHTNGKPAARAAGVIVAAAAPAGSDAAQPPAEEEEESFLDMAKGFFSQMWRPTVASPAPNTEPADDDKILCSKHPPMPPQYLAEGSSKVTINGHPACRSGDRSTCEAVIVDAGLISDNVRIGGGSIVVREIRSGKTPGIGLAITALMLLRGRGGKFYSKFGCMVIGGIASAVTSQVSGAITNAIAGSLNPVHAPTGAKILSGEEELDFSLPALIPLDWQRYYNSRDERRDGLFGAGWSVDYEVFVAIETHPEGSERLLFTDEQARVVDMGNIPRGDAVFSAGEGLSVRRALDDELLIESSSGLYRLFQPTPGNPQHLRLAQLGDRNDNRLYLDYDASGRLLRLRDTFDAVQVQLVYSAQWPARVSHIERLYSDDSSELLVSYAYDSNGDLAEVRDAAGQLQRRFAYDQGRRMVEHQLPSGLRCFYEWTRAADDWRVARHWTDDGDEYRFDYDIEAGITRITDGLQRVSTRYWNPQYQITEYTDAVGLTWRFEWNDERQLLGATDPQGGQWQYLYDESGNLCESIDPLGRSESTLWLEHWSLPRVQTDKAGKRWSYRYDQRGNCSSETDPLGRTTRYRYDDRGQVVEIIDAAGKHKQLHWNDLGLLIEQVDCSGYPTRFSYDRRGYLQAVIDALGERTEYQNDAQGRVVATQLPDGRSERYELNSSGQLSRYIDPAGHVLQFRYNRRGQLLQSIDPHGRQVQYSYDNYGRLLALTNENGESYRFSWDLVDRLTRQQDLDGSARRYEYGPLDNVSRLEFVPAPYGSGLALVPDTTPKSIVHQYTRDAAGRLLAKQTDDGRTDFSYDPLDQLTTVCFTDNDGNTEQLAFAYDAAGQLVQEHSANGALQHHYDELGNLVQSQLPDGRWLNRLYYGSGHLHQLNLDGKVISDFERDRLHREVLRTQGRVSTRSEYDRSGRLRSRLRRPSHQPPQLPAAVQQRFDFDPADNLTSRLNQQPGSQHQQLLHYDASGRIMASQDAGQGQSEAFTYDAAANLLDGPQAGAGLVRHNRLLTYQDKRYRYDAFGRLIEKRSSRRGVQHFSYDAEHRLIQVRSQHGGRQRVLNMRYDPLGRRTEKSEYDEHGNLLDQTRFTWDGLRLLQEHRHSQTSLYLYVQNSYEPLARVDGTGPQQQVRYYHNDLNGLPEQLTEDTGEALWQARYQVWGNTLQEVREAHFIEEQNLRFQGQYLDRETGLHYNLFRFYDPDVGRFTQPDPIGLAGGLNLYQYAANPVGWIDPLGLNALLPGEGGVGAYGKLPGTPGDNLTGHHMPSAEYMKQKFGISRNKSIAMQMEHIYPENKGRHPMTRSYSRRPFLNEKPRDALARDIWDARKIYKQQGLYTKEIQAGLRETIRQNKSTFPNIFKKPSKCGGK